MSFNIGSVATCRVPVARPAGGHPSFTGTVKQGEVVTAHEGEWSGAGTISFAYQWFNSVHGQLAGNGAGTNAYTPQATDVGDKLRCRITATSSIHGATVDYTPWTGAVAGP